MRRKKTILIGLGAAALAALLLSGCAENFTGKATDKLTGKPASYGDVSFDHDPHTDSDCKLCHALGIEKGDTPSALNLPSMSTCVGCHTKGGEAPEECSTCHSDTAYDKPPADHLAFWDKKHGMQSRFTDSCVWCHDETSCDDCHTTKRPFSHTPTWTRSGHGREADFDRTRCDTCHMADECSRCHEAKPFSHFSAGFSFGGGHGDLAARRGGTRSCKVCHDTDFCATCHSE